MPIYEYKCLSCGKKYDEYLPLERSAEPVPCPDCGGASRKVFGLAGFFDGVAGFKPGYYFAFGKNIESVREFRRALRETEIENESYTYEDIDVDTGEPTGEIKEVYVGCKLEAELL